MNKILKMMGLIVLLLFFAFLVDGILGIVMGLLMLRFDMYDKLLQYSLFISLAVKGMILYFFINHRRKNKKLAGKSYVVNRGIQKESWKFAIIGAGCFAFGIGLINVLLLILGDSFLATDIVQTLEQLTNVNSFIDFMMVSISIVILAPVVEELMFRGVLLDESLAVVSPQTAIILNGLIFGLYHMNIIQGVNTFFLGMVLSLVYYYRRNISDAIIIHMVNNLLATLIEGEGVMTYVLMGLAIICFFFAIKFLKEMLAKGRVKPAYEEVN